MADAMLSICVRYQEISVPLLLRTPDFETPGGYVNLSLVMGRLGRREQVREERGRTLAIHCHHLLACVTLNK